MKPTVNDASPSIRSHPKRTPYFLIAALLFVASVLFTLFAPWDAPANRHWANRIILLLIAPLLSGIGIAGLIYALTAFVDVSENGLRWRGGTAAWAEVRDYYIQWSLQSQKHHSPYFVVEFERGKRLAFSPDWQNRKALCAAIEQRATQAKVKPWGVKGARPEDDEWPRRFDYNTLDNRFMPAVMLCLGAAMGIYLPYRFFSQTVGFHAEMGWAWTLGLFAAMTLTICLVPAFLMTLVFPLWRESRKRRKHALTLSRDGLIFTDGDRRIAARWDEVTAYGIRSLKPTLNVFFVVTKSGGCDFLASLRDFRLAIAFIGRMAPGDGVWKHEEEVENLAPIPNADAAPDVHIHHYRTRTNRAFLFLIAAIGVFPLVALALRLAFGLYPLQTELILAIFATTETITLLLYIPYRTFRIETDAEGITKSTLFGGRTLRWQDVTTLDEGGLDTVRAGKASLRYGSAISDVEVLRSTIRQQIENGKDNEK